MNAFVCGREEGLFVPVVPGRSTAYKAVDEDGKASGTAGVNAGTYLSAIGMVKVLVRQVQLFHTITPGHMRIVYQLDFS